MKEDFNLIIYNMKNEDPETYYLDNDKWIRLLKYIEEDGQIPEDNWDKYVNYSYSRPKLEKKIKEFRQEHDRQPTNQEEAGIISKMKQTKLIPCIMWEERYFIPTNWDTEIFFKNIRATKIFGYTLIGTNDPINNPYTVFNLLSININYNQWTPEFKKIVGSGMSGRILNWKVYPNLNTLFETAGFNNIDREFKSILECLTHIFISKTGNDQIKNNNIDNLSYQLKKYEVFTKPYTYPFGKYSVTQIAEFTHNNDMLKFIDAANWRYENRPDQDFYLLEQMNNPYIPVVSAESSPAASPRQLSRQISPRVSPIEATVPIALPRQVSIESLHNPPSPRQLSRHLSIESLGRNPSSPRHSSNNSTSSYLSSQSSRQSSKETMKIKRSQERTKKGFLYGDTKKCIQENKKIAQLQDKIDILYKTKKEITKVKNTISKKLIRENNKLTRKNNKLRTKLKLPKYKQNIQLSEKESRKRESNESIKMSRTSLTRKKTYLWGEKCILEHNKINNLKDIIDNLEKEIKTEKKIKKITVDYLVKGNKQLINDNHILQEKWNNNLLGWNYSS